MSPTIALYAFANFIIGTGAFVLGGLLSAISLELDIGIATAGQAMTAYAIAAGLLAPGLVVLTGHWSRRRTVALALALCALGNLVCAIATALPVLLAGRVLMAWCASGFAVMPAQQARLAAASPGDTPVLLSLNSALLNLGTASSAAIGGLASAWLGMGHLAWAGVPFIVLGLITLRA